MRNMNNTTCSIIGATTFIGLCASNLIVFVICHSCNSITSNSSKDTLVIDTLVIDTLVSEQLLRPLSVNFIGLWPLSTLLVVLIDVRKCIKRNDM